ncbi:MAG: hypothetical protein ABI321_19785 [Polyangia bacterium]
MTVKLRCLSIFLALAGAAVATPAHADSRWFGQVKRGVAATIRQKRVEDQTRQRRQEEQLRRGRIMKEPDMVRHEESPFWRSNRTESAWSSRNPWMAATHPSLAPRVNKSLWQRTGAPRMTIAGQMKTDRSAYQVSSVHQLMMRNTREEGPHLDMLNAYARHGASQHGAHMHGMQMHGAQMHGGRGVDNVFDTATTMSAGPSLFASIK